MHVNGPDVDVVCAPKQWVKARLCAAVNVMNGGRQRASTGLAGTIGGPAVGGAALSPAKEAASEICDAGRALVQKCTIPSPCQAQRVLWG